MKTHHTLAALTLILFFGNCQQKQEAKQEATQPVTAKKAVDAILIQPQSERDTLKGSLRAIATGKIGNTVITVNYYSPAVRGRVIWGGLVPLDQVWVTGAHQATSIEFEGAVKIGDVELPSGKYGFFTIPSKGEWTLIINKNWEQHLSDEYDPKDDLVRVRVKPELEDANQERLRYLIEAEGGKQGELAIYWEKLEVSLPITVVN